MVQNVKIDLPSTSQLFHEPLRPTTAAVSLHVWLLSLCLLQSCLGCLVTYPDKTSSSNSRRCSSTGSTGRASSPEVGTDRHPEHSAFAQGTPKPVLLDSSSNLPALPHPSTIPKKEACTSSCGQQQHNHVSAAGATPAVTFSAAFTIQMSLLSLNRSPSKATTSLDATAQPNACNMSQPAGCQGHNACWCTLHFVECPARCPDP